MNVQSTQPLPVVRQSPKGSRATRLLAWLLVLVALCVILLIAGRLASEAVVKPYVANQVEREVSAGVESFVSSEIAGLPLVEDAPQQYIVSERELNQQIADHPDLGPLDDVQAEITETGIVVHLRAYNVSGVYRAGIQVRGGSAVVEGGSMSGALGFIVPVEDLERAANEAIARSLSASGVRVKDVTLADGEIALTLEPSGAENGTPGG